MTRRPLACDRWAPIITREKHCTHTFYPGAWVKLDYRVWWREYRLVLAAAVPWYVTNKEYVTRWRVLAGLYDRLGG